MFGSLKSWLMFVVISEASARQLNSQLNKLASVLFDKGNFSRILLFHRQ